MVENGLPSGHVVNDPTTQQNDTLRFVQEEFFKMQQNFQNMAAFFHEQIQKQNEQIQKQNEENYELRKLVHDLTNVNKTRDLKETLQIPNNSVQNYIKENQKNKQQLVEEEINHEEPLEEVKEDHSFKELTMRQIAEYSSSKDPPVIKKDDYLISSLSSVQFKSTLQDFFDTEADVSEDIIREASQLIFEHKPYNMGLHVETISQEKKVIDITRITNIKDSLKAYFANLTREEKDKFGFNVLEAPTLAYVVRPTYGLWAVLKSLVGDVEKFKSLFCQAFGADFTIVKPMLVNPNKISVKGEQFKQKIPLIYVEFPKTNEAVKQRFISDEFFSFKKEIYDSNREIIARVSPFIRRDFKKVSQPVNTTSKPSEEWIQVGKKGRIVENKTFVQVAPSRTVTFAQMVKEKNNTQASIKQPSSDISQLCEILRRQNEENKTHFALLYQALNIPFPSNLKFTIKPNKRDSNRDQE